MSKIRDNLVKITGCAHEDEQTYGDWLEALIVSAAQLSDTEWDQLSEDSQNWVNSAINEYKSADRDPDAIPDFPDWEEGEAEPESEEIEDDEEDLDDDPESDDTDEAGEDDEVEEEPPEASDSGPEEEESEVEDDPPVEDDPEEEAEPEEAPEEPQDSEETMAKTATKRKKTATKKTATKRKKTTTKKKKTTKKKANPGMGRASEAGNEFLKTFLKNPTWDRDRIMRDLERRKKPMVTKNYSNIVLSETRRTLRLLDELGYYTHEGMFVEEE